MTMSGGRRTIVTYMRNLWCALLVGASFDNYAVPSCLCCFAQTWRCRLEWQPVQNITLTPSQRTSLLSERSDGHGDGEGVGGRRQLLRYSRWGKGPKISSAIALSGDDDGGSPLERRRTRDDGYSQFDHVVNTTTSSPEDQDVDEAMIASLFGPHTNTTAIDEDDDDNNNDDDLLLLEGRRCTCAAATFPSKKDVNYYCPKHADYCSVWRHRYTGEHEVTCYEDRGWKIGFSREIWYYLIFCLGLLVLYPIFTRPGQHAVKYLLSRCFPRMNAWITEQLLRSEIEANGIIMNDFERAARLKRRSEGWISGYSLKTKRYRHRHHSSGEEDDDGDATTTAENKKAEYDDANSVEGTDNIVVCGDNDDDGNDSLEEENEDSSREAAPRDEGEVENEECVCTICLLPLEDGDRVADLTCGHLYHADCLGEWILKKNSCPLCQSPEIARQIRSFETDDDIAAAEGDGGDNAAAENVFSRWRRQAIENMIDVATGGSQWSHNIRIHRMRMASNEQT